MSGIPNIYFKAWCMCVTVLCMFVCSGVCWYFVYIRVCVCVCAYLHTFTCVCRFLFIHFTTFKWAISHHNKCAEYTHAMLV